MDTAREPGIVDERETNRPSAERILQLPSRRELRLVFGQRASSFQMSDVLRDNKILLINLKGRPSASSKLVGTLLMNAVWRATKTTKKTSQTFLMMDESGTL